MLIINTDEPTLFVTFVFFQHKIVRLIFRIWFYAEFLFTLVVEEKEDEEEEEEGEGEVDIEEEVGLKTLMEQDPDLSKVKY